MGEITVDLSDGLEQELRENILPEFMTVEEWAEKQLRKAVHEAGLQDLQEEANREAQEAQARRQAKQVATQTNGEITTPDAPPGQ